MFIQLQGLRSMGSGSGVPQKGPGGLRLGSLTGGRGCMRKRVGQSKIEQHPSLEPPEPLYNLAVFPVTLWRI